MQILKYPDPILAQYAEPVTDFGEEFQKLAGEVYMTMLKLPQGSVAGLAAPQCGVSLRFFFALGQLFVNPTIRTSKQVEMALEGCFSDPEGPGKQYRVWRSKSVWIKYQDFTGKHCEERFNGYKARVILHELDHLNGVMCMNREKIVYGTTK